MSNLKRRKIAHSSLHDMLRDPDIQAEEIHAFLDRDKSSINEVDRRGETPLSVALTMGNCSASIVNILLKYGGNINFSVEDGSSILVKALKYNGDETVIKVLLEALDATDVNEVYRYDETPLRVAIKHNRSANIFKLLIQHGADVRHRPFLGESVLKRALESNCDEAVIKVLLKALNATDVNEKDMFNNTPLIVAIEHNRSGNIVKLLLQKDADVRYRNCLGETVLMKALRYNGDETVFKVLLEALDAIDVNEVYWYLYTPFRVAIEHNRSANIVKLLLQKGADVGHRDLLDELVLKMAIERNCDEATVQLLTKYSCLKIENFDVGLSLEGVASFAADCKQEVREMVSVDLGGGRTLRQVVSEHSSSHACVANEIEESRNILNQLLERRLEVVCPIYFDMILVKIKKQAMVTKLQQALLHSITDFSSVSGLEKVLLNYKCAFGISQYLPNDTLYRMLQMFYIPH